MVNFFLVGPTGYGDDIMLPKPRFEKQRSDLVGDFKENNMKKPPEGSRFGAFA